MKAVILAGGSGSRLWPLSRDAKPKQFHAFVGAKTMLLQTYERLSFLRPADIFVATTLAYKKIVLEQLPRLAPKHLILEPAMRDTGPCMAFAAHHLERLGFGDEVMAIVYADHLVRNEEHFREALLFAEAHVQKTDCLAVIGVRAKYANPNLGYIGIGAVIAEKQGPSDLEVYELKNFVEKPSVARAKKFLTSFKYLWNTGLYLWRPRTFLKLLKEASPTLWKCASSATTYGRCPKISIDYALIEKIPPSRIHVIPADLDWNDIGNWAALHEELAESENANVAVGNHIALETEGSIIFGRKEKLIVTYGLKNAVVVDTEEALLIMPKEKASEAKKIMEELKKKGGVFL